LPEKTRLFRNITEVLQSGDYTANRHFAKIENTCAAMVVPFTNWAFGGLKAQFAKVQLLWIFGENQTNRRLILSKVSWVYILRRELLPGRRYRPT
jgi:hypothetical protein